MSWPMVPLGELMATRTPSLDPAKFPEEEFELWSIPAFDAGAPETALGATIGSAKKVVEPNDVLLSRIVPHIRRSWVVAPSSDGKRQIASGEWIIFRGDRIYPSYLRHVLVGDTFHAAFMGTVAGVGGSLLRARPEAVKRIEIALPPLPEQRRIAAILDQADALRRLRRQSLSRLSDLGQAIFFEMFGGEKSTTENALNEYVTFMTSGGRGWAKYYADKGDRFIRSLDVQMGFISNEDVAYVVPPNSAEARRTRVQGRDILLTITGSRIGRVACLAPDFGTGFVSQHVAIIRLDQTKIAPEYVAFFLGMETGGQRQIAKSQYGQTKPGLNFEQIGRFKIPVPPIEQQIKFLQILQDIAKTSSLNEDRFDGIERLFASIQHRAFRGEL